MTKVRTLATWALCSSVMCFGLLLAARAPLRAQEQAPRVNLYKVAPKPPDWKGGTKGPIDLKIMDPALVGAIDMHAHLDPDISGGGQATRAMDVIDNARLAKSRGMRGFTFKTHMDITSAAGAYTARKIVPGLEVFARYSMNLPSGGLNPASVVQFTMIKGNYGRVIEFPTRDVGIPRVENRPWVQPWLEFFPNYAKEVPVVVNGELNANAKAMIAFIAKLNTTRGNEKLIIATGHASPANHVIIAREARRMNVPVLITHPGDNVTDAQFADLKQMGAWIEVNCDFYQDGGVADDKVSFALKQFKRIGAEQIIMGTDCGQTDNPFPADCIALGAKALRANGIAEPQLNLVFKTNPAKLLGIPPPAMK